MSVKLLEMRRKRAALVNEARVILDQVEGESRDLNAEEQAKYDALMDDVDKRGTQIQREERQGELESELRESNNEPNRPNPQGDGREGETAPELRRAFQQYLRAGRSAVPEAELRALQADSDTGGGFLVMPMEVVDTLIKKVDDELFIRRLATVQRVERSESLGAPSLDNDPADADWTSELATGNEDSTMDFGKRELTPHPLGKRLKVSRKLIRLTPDVEGLVTDRLAYKFGVTHEKAFMTGHGSGQPLGCFTANANGISTSRDVSTGNTTTSIQTDGLIEAKFTLKGQYWPRAAWVFHRDGVKQIRKLKDGEGQYIWQAGILSGAPDRILDLPYYMSEYAPNTFTTGLYAGIVGDFKNYWIADALDMTIQRLEELYAETNQIGFIGRWESDGMPVLEEAFARVKLA